MFVIGNTALQPARPAGPPFSVIQNFCIVGWILTSFSSLLYCSNNYSLLQHFNLVLILSV